MTHTTLRMMRRAGAVAAVSLALSGAALAAEKMPQTLSVNPEGRVVMQNAELTAVSGSELKVKIWGMTWTILVTPDTRLHSRGGDRIELAHMKVGDSLRVLCDTSAETPLTCKARAVYDRSARISRRAVSGTIAAVNPPDAFLLRTEKGEVKVKTTAETKITANGETATFADLAVGLRATARGVFEADTQTLTATHVNVRKPRPEKPERSNRNANTNSSATGTSQ